MSRPDLITFLRETFWTIPLQYNSKKGLRAPALTWTLLLFNSVVLLRMVPKPAASGNLPEMQILRSSPNRLSQKLQGRAQQPFSQAPPQDSGAPPAGEPLS